MLLLLPIVVSVRLSPVVCRFDVCVTFSPYAEFGARKGAPLAFFDALDGSQAVGVLGVCDMNSSILRFCSATYDFLCCFVA